MVSLVREVWLGGLASGFFHSLLQFVWERDVDRSWEISTVCNYTCQRLPLCVRERVWECSNGKHNDQTRLATVRRCRPCTTSQTHQTSVYSSAVKWMSIVVYNSTSGILQEVYSCLFFFCSPLLSVVPCLSPSSLKHSYKLTPKTP